MIRCSEQDYRGELIFLTGCIQPNGMSFTKLQDPPVRQNQYVDAIRFYLNNSTLPLLFVENSGVDISDLFQKEITEGRLEIIAFNGNNYDKKLGKGYGEMLIIEKALKNSLFLKNSQFVFKITGRYQLLNLDSYLEYRRKSNGLELMVDLRRQLQYADSRFWGSSINFLVEILLKYKEEINDSNNFYFEHALCYATHEAISKKYSFSVLKYKPRFKGTYATDNKKYRSSFIYWWPLNVKQFIKYKFFSG
jgi:hypothetical protein